MLIYNCIYLTAKRSIAAAVGGVECGGGGGGASVAVLEEIYPVAQLEGGWDAGVCYYRPAGREALR